MHVMLSWRVRDASYETAAHEAHERLSGVSYALAFEGTYVIRLDADTPEAAELERSELVDRFADIAAGDDPRISVLVSPVMNGGMYQGWLEGSVWDEINRRSAKTGDADPTSA